MALYPRYGKVLQEDARPFTPQVQEKLTRLDEERLEGFGFRELGMFKLRTSRAIPGEYFLEGAPGPESERERLAIAPVSIGDATV